MRGSSLFSRGWPRLGRDARGVAAVEFAIVAPLLLACICAVLALGIDQFAQMTLDDSVRNAARQLQLGLITDRASFVASVCGGFALGGGGCAADLDYVVQGGSTFASLVPAALNASGTLALGGATASVFNPAGNCAAGASCNVLVQVAYRLPIVLPVLSGTITGTGTPAILSAIAVGTEP